MSFFHFSVSLVLLAASVYGQTTAVSQVSGTVQDPTGAGIVGAAVKITHVETGSSRTVESASDGSYVLANLPVGPYRLQVSKEGFNTFVQSGIVLQVDSNPTINVVLKVGSISEQVTVEANAAMVETHDNAIGQVVDSKSVVDLPLNGRQVTQLIQLSGGAVNLSASTGLIAARNYPSAAAVSVAGGQGSGTQYLLDGGINMDVVSNVSMPLPFPDAIQEFKVETSDLPAQYGLHPGGVVNVVTKSGGNVVHGSAFEFVRNGDFNARNTFATKRDTLKRNQFGGTGGGPIVKNKLFFFTGYQGTIQRSDPANTLSFVPTAAVLAGNFTQITSPACNNGKQINIGGPFAQNQIAPALFNQQALNILKYVPVSSDPCGRFVYGIPNDSSEHQGLVRVDYQQSPKNSIFGRYYAAGYALPPTFDGSNILTTSQAGLSDLAQTLTLGDTYLFKPNLMSSFRAEVTRLAIDRYYPDNVPTTTQLGVNVTQQMPNYLLINVSNFFSFANQGSSPAHFNTTTYQIAEDFNFVHGSHQFSFGLDWIHPQLNGTGLYLLNGRFAFNGSRTGYSLADFLLGMPNQFEQGNGQIAYDRANSFALYAQDSWRISSRLSLNYGIRWEPYFPQYQSADYVSHFEPSWFSQGLKSTVYVNAPPGITYHGDPGFPGDSVTFGKLGDFAPRLGVVFDPRGDGRQTIRAGYGIFYDFPIMWETDHFPLNPPWGEDILMTNPAGGLSNPWLSYPGGNPFPTPNPPPKNVTFPQFGAYVNFPLHVQPMYTQQWNLSYQRQLAKDWLLSATYLGNKSTHVRLGYESNSAVYIPGTCGTGPCSTTSNENQRRPLYLQNPLAGQYYGSILMANDGANANYNGLVVALNKRLSHNLSALVNYTWSHCLDEGENGIDTSNAFQNPNNFKGDYGNCGQDRRHIVNASIIAQMPAIGPRLVSKLVGGWQLSAILSKQTGAYLTVTSGLDNSLTGIGADRPNANGSPVLADPTFTHWFNTSVFSQNATGTFGDAGRSIIEGPGLVDLDMGLVRRIALPGREGLSLELRAEAFNILNHANGLAVTTTLTSGTFGQVTSALDPRIMQFAVKLRF